MFDTDRITAMIRAKLPEADFVRVTELDADEAMFTVETETPFGPDGCNCARKVYVANMEIMMLIPVNGMGDHIDLED